jgi:hypothetical protein
MTQRTLVVSRALVDGLVSAFLASKKGRDHRYCSSFRPADMEAVFRALPGLDVVSFQAASQVVTAFECPKMTTDCNAWTPWMRHRLNQNKFTLASAVALS